MDQIKEIMDNQIKIIKEIKIKIVREIKIKIIKEIKIVKELIILKLANLHLKIAYVVIIVQLIFQLFKLQIIKLT